MWILSGIKISPRLINSAIASRRSSSNLSRLFWAMRLPLGDSHQDFNPGSLIAVDRVEAHSTRVNGTKDPIVRMGAPMASEGGRELMQRISCFQSTAYYQCSDIKIPDWRGWSLRALMCHALCPTPALFCFGDRSATDAHSLSAAEGTSYVP